MVHARQALHALQAPDRTALGHFTISVVDQLMPKDRIIAMIHASRSHQLSIPYLAQCFFQAIIHLSYAGQLIDKFEGAEWNR
jgi:hypothetical protein